MGLKLTDSLWSSTILAGALALSPSALAQETDAPEEPISVEEAEADEEARQQRIVVTGSRIARDNFASANPVTIITADDSALAGLVDTSDILQGSPIASGEQINDSFSGFVTDGGAGANSVSLRGLGAQRTLVLVNGRRWVPSGTRGAVNTVDLTAIPTSIISRVEILKDGASSIYGADAVAGVINIITRDNLDGFQINGAASVTQEGGGEGYNIDLSWGKVLDRTSFSVSAGYARQNKLEAIERDYSQCPISPRLTDQDFDGTLDNRNPITNEELCFGFIYGLVSSPFGFVRYEPGLTNADPSDPFFDAGIAGFGIPNYTRTPINGFDTRPGADPTSDFFDNDGAFYRDELSPTVQNIVSERDTFYAVGQVSHDFELAGRATTAFAEIFLNRRETAATGGYRQFFPAVPGTNPTNPFGTNGPLAGFGGFTVLPVLPSYQIQDPTQRVEVDRGQLYAGLRGDLFGDTWTYEAVFGYGTSEGTYEQDNWLQNQVDFAVDAIFDTNGNLVCRPLDANAPADIQADFSGCVPLQLFTSEALLAGSLPADQLNYISKVTVGNTTYDQLTFNAFASGDLFELPAGTVQGVFGVDYRYQEIVDTPDIEAQRDNVWGRSVAGITEGDDTVTEAFVEFEIPILGDTLLSEELTLNLSGRYTNYDSFGDDTTYKASANYTITPEVRVRGSVGTSFRAPALFEQFLGNQTAFADGFLDPCINFADVSEPGDDLYDNCIAEVPVFYPGNINDDPQVFPITSITSITGGSQDLEAETSESTTIGVIFTPEAIPVRFAVDYFNIDLENEIASISVGGILGACYNSPNRSDPLCSRVGDRDPVTLNIDSVDASFVNVALQSTSGYDFSARWDQEFESGDLVVDGLITYIENQESEILDTVEFSQGRWGFPRWTGAIDTRYEWNDWTFSWDLDFIGDSSEPESENFDPGTEVLDRIVSTDLKIYHALGVRYQANDWEVIGTVRNVFDEQPPIVSPVGGASATRVFNTLPGVGYDLLGRTLVVQASRRF